MESDVRRIETDLASGLFPKIYGAGRGHSNRHDIPSASAQIVNDISNSSGWAKTSRSSVFRIRGLSKVIATLIFLSAFFVSYVRFGDEVEVSVEDFRRPAFVNERPYVTSTYYSTTMSEKTLYAGSEHDPQIHNKDKSEDDKRKLKEPKTRLAILRPFCAFDAEALPTTFAAWESLPPCKAAVSDIGDIDDDLDNYNGTSSDEGADVSADMFLFYSQSYFDSPEAVTAVDSIIATFNEPGGWSECFENIYAIEANIPPELDLYLPSAQEDLYNWVNGPNRQYEAGFRVIQSGEWGQYDGFYLMEGDSIPVKAHWLDVLLEEIEKFRPFAILGAKYNGDKWDQFYEKIPISLLHHINGNGIYNTSHPLLDRLVGQLEVEAPCPFNSIPYDYRMSQMATEGALGIVPKLAPKIMLNEDGQNITLSNNTAMFGRWWDRWGPETPFKETPAIHNYAATNLVPRHLGPEYVIHGAKLYSPWSPKKNKITLVISEWFSDRSSSLLSHLDEAEHPFSEIVLMLPPSIPEKEVYNETRLPVKTHHRLSSDFMDLCDAPIDTEWFMLTNSYHHVAKHVDLMFTPGAFKPVIPFTPATYPFCLKFPYCKETVTLAQRTSKGHDKVVQDFDMLYHTETRNAFCTGWKENYGTEGEDLYKKDRRALRRKKFIGPKGPTGTDYTAYLVANGKDGMYKFTDRSLYGARNPFLKVFAKQEKMDGLSAEDLAKLSGVTGFDNTTDCSCSNFETAGACAGSGLGCVFRAVFQTCHPPEQIDDGSPICPETPSPTMAPTVDLDGRMDDTEAPTSSPVASSSGIVQEVWYESLFKVREHERERPEKTERAADKEE